MFPSYIQENNDKGENICLLWMLGFLSVICMYEHFCVQMSVMPLKPRRRLAPLDKKLKEAINWSHWLLGSIFIFSKRAARVLTCWAISSALKYLCLIEILYSSFYTLLNSEDKFFPKIYVLQYWKKIISS